jgi:CRP-like cAMP-binding protein
MHAEPALELKPSFGLESDRFGLFAGLTGAQRDHLLALTMPWRAAPGEVILRQGEPADRLFAMASGHAQVSIRAGGGEERKLATLDAGAVLGEMALLTTGRRTATVRALAHCTGIQITRDTFDLLRLRQDPAALAVVDEVGRTALRRLRRRYAALAAELGAGHPLERENVPSPGCALEAVDSTDATGHYLGGLMFFRRFSPEQVEAVTTLGTMRYAPRDAALELGDSLWIVLRGAVEVSLVNGRRQRVRLAGPGRCIGHLLVDGAEAPPPAPVEHRTRERAVLLELAAPAVRELRAGTGGASARFVEALHEDAVRALLAAEGAHPPLTRADLPPASARAASGAVGGG